MEIGFLISNVSLFWSNISFTSQIYKVSNEKFLHQKLGDRLETMNDYTRREEKIVLNDTVDPERWSPFYDLTTEDSNNLWIKVTRTAERYAGLNYTDDTWLTVAEHNNFDHDNLGIGT